MAACPASQALITDADRISVSFTTRFLDFAQIRHLGHWRLIPAPEEERRQSSGLIQPICALCSLPYGPTATEQLAVPMLIVPET